MTNPINNFARETIMKNAAKAMASWFMENGLDAPTLAQRLQAGEPVLDNALNAVPKDQIGGVRAMVAPVIKSFTNDDYAKILSYVWEYKTAYPPCEGIAVLLQDPTFFWTYYQPAMEKVKVWLATGSPA